METTGAVRIGELSRRSGVSPELLRAWERRYGLLQPTRSAGGLRLYSPDDLARVQAMQRHLAEETTFEDFFAAATLNPNASLITGSICGIRVEEVEDPLMQKIRYLDKLVDELAKGKAMEKVLRA